MPEYNCIALARKTLEKTYMEPKQVFSAVINSHDPYSWLAGFGQDPFSALRRTVVDLCRMRWAVLEHPLCTAFAQALLAAGKTRHVTLSLCLGHLDEQALLAVAAHLDRAGARTGLTVNDSLTVLHRSLPATIPRPSLARLAATAARHALGYPLRFTYLPGLRKPDAPPLTLAAVAAELGVATGGDAAPSDSEDDGVGIVRGAPWFRFPGVAAGARADSDGDSDGDAGHDAPPHAHAPDPFLARARWRCLALARVRRLLVAWGAVASLESRARACARAVHEPLAADDGAGVFDDLPTRRRHAALRLQAATLLAGDTRVALCTVWRACGAGGGGVGGVGVGGDGGGDVDDDGGDEDDGWDDGGGYDGWDDDGSDGYDGDGDDDDAGDRGDGGVGGGSGGGGSGGGGGGGFSDADASVDDAHEWGADDAYVWDVDAYPESGESDGGVGPVGGDEWEIDVDGGYESGEVDDDAYVWDAGVDPESGESDGGVGPVGGGEWEIDVDGGHESGEVHDERGDESPLAGGAPAPPVPPLPGAPLSMGASGSGPGRPLPLAGLQQQVRGI